MTVVEIKTEITKKLEYLPEDALNDVLHLVSELQHRTEEELKRDKNFEKIIADNEEVFKRLAK